MHTGGLNRVGALAFFWMAAAAGCGGGSGPTFMTSVPAGTKLTALTAAQQTQLCNDLESFTQQALTATLCKTAGVGAAEDILVLQGQSATDADLRTACTQAYDSCVSPDGGGTTTLTCNVGSEPSTCQATVGDLQTCLNDESSALQHLSASVPSCSSLTVASLQAFLSSSSSGSSGNSMEPASCSKFDSTCNVMM
jgi:hypothetical protein